MQFMADTWAAVVLAGGAARRLGGVDKVMLRVGGTPMLLRVIAGVRGATPIVVVGPESLHPRLPDRATLVADDPPGGGPVAGLAAGLAEVPAEATMVAMLGGDLPFLSPEAVALLRIAATTDGAVFVDGEGRRQLLCGVWRAAALRERLAAVGDPYGVAMRTLVEGLAVTEVTWPAVEAPPWYDCDTDADLRHAQELTR